MLGALSSLIGGIGKVKGFNTQARQALLRGEAEKSQLYSRARTREQQAKQQALDDGYNMMVARGNQRRAVGEAENLRGASGFVRGNGDGELANKVRSLHEGQIANMALESSARSLNAVNEAAGLRLAGQNAMANARAEYNQLKMMANKTKQGMWVSGLASVAGGIAGGIKARDSARRENEAAKAFNEANAEDIKAGRVEAKEEVDVWDATLKGGFMGLDTGMSAGNAFNPYLSEFVQDGWEKRFLRMIGYGK